MVRTLVPMQTSKQSMSIQASKENYIKQSDSYTSGPTALYNLLIWSGFPFTYQETNIMAKLMALCISKLNPNLGTLYQSFSEALRMLLNDPHSNLDLVAIRIQPRYTQIKEHLCKGGSIVVKFHWSRLGKAARHVSDVLNWKIMDEAGEHYVLIDELNPLGVYVINYGQRYPVRCFLTKYQMKEILEPFQYPTGSKYDSYQDRVYPIVWFFKTKLLTQ